MSFLIDTDIASGYLQGNANIFKRFMQYGGGLFISVLSVAELYSWVYVAEEPTHREEGLLAMLSDVTVLPLDDGIARRAGRIRASLQRHGVKVPTIDMLIAASALEHDLTVATHNSRHFSLVPDLRIEDWLI